MKVFDLFCGTKSFANVAKERGHETFTVDNDKRFNPDWCGDIRDFSCFSPPEVIWASPPCQAFSVAAIGKNWHKDTREPKSDRAREGLELIHATLSIIWFMQPQFWFIENPRGMLRKLPVMEGLKRHTVTYCQYGDTRMKPTDIWTNADISFLPPCKNGDSCHISAPRGSRTGTQGLGNAIERARVPYSLCEQILKYCETNYQPTKGE